MRGVGLDGVRELDLERLRRSEEHQRKRRERPWRCPARSRGLRCYRPAGHAGQHECVAGMNRGRPRLEFWHSADSDREPGELG